MAPTTRAELTARKENDVPDDRSLATVELLGALTYGQLRTFESSARAVRLAPDARRMDALAEHAVREHAGYCQLRDRLADLTELGEAVMDRQKPLFDDFFDHAPLEDWLGACAFFATGLPMAADFVRAVAPTLDATTAEAVVQALVERSSFERFAIRELVDLMADNDIHRERTKHLVSDLLGRALTGFRTGVHDTDALTVLLGDGDPGQDAAAELVKRVVMTVLEGHRRRAHQLGLEELIE